MKRKNARIDSQHTISGFRARFKEQVPRVERFVNWMTSAFGTTGFLIGNTIFFASWLAVNLGLFGDRFVFDPFPFNFLTAAVSLQAIFLSIIVLMSQNRAARMADLREEMDFEINLRSEAEVTRILNMLDEIHDHLGLENSDDEELEEMKQKIDVMQIRRDIEEGDK
jgi:uncharacterized membrane protein